MATVWRWDSRRRVAVDLPPDDFGAAIEVDVQQFLPGRLSGGCARHDHPWPSADQSSGASSSRAAIGTSLDGAPASDTTRIRPSVGISTPTCEPSGDEISRVNGGGTVGVLVIFRPLHVSRRIATEYIDKSVSSRSTRTQPVGRARPRTQSTVCSSLVVRQPVTRAARSRCAPRPPVPGGVNPLVLRWRDEVIQPCPIRTHRQRPVFVFWSRHNRLGDARFQPTA